MFLNSYLFGLLEDKKKLKGNLKNMLSLHLSFVLFTLDILLIPPLISDKQI